jgi:hypothetical protein
VAVPLRLLTGFPFQIDEYSIFKDTLKTVFQYNRILINYNTFLNAFINSTTAGKNSCAMGALTTDLDPDSIARHLPLSIIGAKRFLLYKVIKTEFILPQPVFVSCLLYNFLHCII